MKDINSDHEFSQQKSIDEKISQIQEIQLNRNDQQFKHQLRQKFIAQASKYIGVPYKKKYADHTYNGDIYLDCCGLIKRVVRDLQNEFGFKISKWNQAYQYDTLPTDLEFSQMQPGDLIFYKGKYFKGQGMGINGSRQQIHNIVHVEIYIGGHNGTQTIGSRKTTGVSIQDSYELSNNRNGKKYHSIQYKFKSIDTWLNGICRSHCYKHKWNESYQEWIKGPRIPHKQQKLLKSKIQTQKYFKF